jgi:hypothetical protein
LELLTSHDLLLEPVYESWRNQSYNCCIYNWVQHWRCSKLQCPVKVEEMIYL